MSLVKPIPVSAIPRYATVADLHALQEAISPARLATYLRQSHFNLRRALELYAWNAGAGAALLPLFQMNEVTLRNAVNAALIHAFGAEWPWSRGFLRALPARDRERFESENRKLHGRLGRRPSTGDVVASQTYWFWVSLFTARFQDRIWNRGFHLAFPTRRGASIAPWSTNAATPSAGCATASRTTSPCCSSTCRAPTIAR